MHEINLGALDLNLLVTLEVLLRERHVTRAAARLGRSQSATSHALGRLREMFEDPLLTPGRPLMLRTPRAEALMGPLSETLEQVRALLVPPQDFDPETSARTWRVGCPDALLPMLPQMLSWLRGEAPQGRLELVAWRGDEVEGALRRGELDLVIGGARDMESPRLHRQALGEVGWVTLAAPEHPWACAPTLDVWLAHPHIQVHTTHELVSFVDMALDRRGLTREIGAVVPSFLAALHVVATSKMLFTGPDALAPLATSLGLTSAVTPLPLPSLTAYAAWHERWAEAPAHRWFRQEFLEQLGLWLGSAP